MGLTNWSIRHTTTIFVLMVILVISGMGAYNTLPREAQPDVTIPYVMVNVPYFGVSPTDIETLIINELEEEFEKLRDVEEIRSTAAESMASVMIEFQAGVDMDTALSNVRERVDMAKPDLPADAEEPIVTEISFSDFPIMNITLSGELGLVELKRIAELLEDDINRITGILDVRVVGGLEREIRVESDPHLMEYYNVSFNEIIGAISNENMNIPGGTIDVGDQIFLVRVPGEFQRVEEIENVVIRAEDGEAIFVRDVAQVIDGFADVTSHSRLDDVQAVSVVVTRRAGENIIRITDELKALVDLYRDSYGHSVSFTVLDDVSDMIHAQLNELENNILTGLMLVLLVLMIFLGNWKKATLKILVSIGVIVLLVKGLGLLGIAVNPWFFIVLAGIVLLFLDEDGSVRTALFIGAAIPFSMLISFTVLSILGITLNIVVLFSLVLALGLLVDNAIIIVENIYRHMTMGKGRVEAAKEAVSEIAWPIISATTTTVGAFAPLLFWPGIMGEFMKYLPITIMVVLISSLFVALVINPVLCATFMKVDPKLVSEASDDGLDETRNIPTTGIYRLYRGTLHFATQSTAGVITTIVGAFVLLFLVLFSFAKFNAGMEFFPSTTPERIKVAVVLPDGSNIEASDRIVRQVESFVHGKEGVKHVVSATGAGTGQDAFGGPGSGTAHQSRISVEFEDNFNRAEQVDGFILELRAHLDTIAGARFEVQREDMGPPTGAPINLELKGQDYITLQNIADQAEQIIANIDGVVDLKSDFETGRQELAIEIDRRQAGMLGVSTLDIASTIRAAVNGTEASVFREDDEEYDIVVRLQEDRRQNLENVSELYVKTPMGGRVQIQEIAEFRVQDSYGAIQHVDAERVITVSAEVAEGFNENAVLLQAMDVIASDLNLPSGYQASWTGQNKEQEQASEFLSTALLAGLFIVALVFITQFNSLLQPGIIMFSVVLSLIGVFASLVIRQQTFVMIMSGVGIISLAAIVVNNGIVLVDYMNQLRKRGLSLQEAALTAGLVRFRPIIMTSVTTVLSLLPTVIGVSLDAKTFTLARGGNSVEMWGPMANAITSGLVVSTILILVVTPAMYVAVEQFSAWFRQLLKLPPKDTDPEGSPPSGGMPSDISSTTATGTQPLSTVSAYTGDLPNDGIAIQGGASS